MAGSEQLCNVTTGAGCTAPPTGAKFYPYWTLSRSCVWNFGTTIPGRTAQTFGGDAQYGTPNIARYGGTIISPVLSNPQISGRCAQHAAKV